MIKRAVACNSVSSTPTLRREAVQVIFFILYKVIVTTSASFTFAALCFFVLVFLLSFASDVLPTLHQRCSCSCYPVMPRTLCMSHIIRSYLCRVGAYSTTSLTVILVYARASCTQYTGAWYHAPGGYIYVFGFGTKSGGVVDGPCRSGRALFVNLADQLLAFTLCR